MSDLKTTLTKGQVVVVKSTKHTVPAWHGHRLIYLGPFDETVCGKSDWLWRGNMPSEEKTNSGVFIRAEHTDAKKIVRYWKAGKVVGHGILHFLYDAVELETPQHEHDCDACKFLGRLDNYDLYYCKTEPTVIARYGVDGEYKSGMVFAEHGHAQLTEALNRAVALGYHKVKKVRKTINK